MTEQLRSWQWECVARVVHIMLISEAENMYAQILYVCMDGCIFKLSILCLPCFFIK